MTVDQIRAMEQSISTTAASAATETTSTSFSSVLQESTSIDSIITKASVKYNVPASLIKAVCKAESNFNAKAVSCCGAQGVMQLMPSTAKSLGVKDAFDPEQDIMGGTKYLSQLLDKYDGNVTYALAAYNAGRAGYRRRRLRRKAFRRPAAENGYRPGPAKQCGVYHL